jgi:urease accessory protein
MKEETRRPPDSSLIPHPSSLQRITAADFVTPPEFRGLRLAPNEAGRIGGLRIELLACGRETRLGHCYQQVPLRILPLFHFPGTRPALLYLLNPTAGLLDGDAQRVELTARAGTNTIVVGQSATRIHPCLEGFATQQWTIRVEAGATVVVLPGPAIPFEACRYYQRVEAELEPGANFIWGDVWLAGRYARGDASERFRFSKLVQDFRVVRRGRLAFRDRFCWQGPWTPEQAAWHFGDGTACGNLFASGSPIRNEPGPGRETGARFTTGQGDTCVRWVGPSERVTGSVVAAATRAAADVTPEGPKEDWSFCDALAPVHWFSR